MSEAQVVAEGSRRRKSKDVNLLPDPEVPLQSDLDGNGNGAKKDATSFKREAESAELCGTTKKGKNRKKNRKKLPDDNCHSHVTEDVNPLPSPKVPLQSELDGNGDGAKEDATSFKREVESSESSETVKKNRRKKKNSRKLPDVSYHSRATEDINPLSIPKVPLQSEFDGNGDGAKEEATSFKREVESSESSETVKKNRRKKKNSKKLPDDNCHSCATEDINPLPIPKLPLQSELDMNGNGYKEDATTFKKKVYSSEVSETPKKKKKMKQNCMKLADEKCLSYVTEDVNPLPDPKVPLQSELNMSGNGCKEDATSLKRKAESAEFCGTTKKEKNRKKNSKKSADGNLCTFATEMNDSGLQSSKVVSCTLQVKPVEDTFLMDNNLMTPINDMVSNDSKERPLEVESTHLQGKKKRRKMKNEEKKQEMGVHPSICTSDKDHRLNSSMLAGQNVVSDCNLALEDSLMITVNCDSVTTLSNEDEGSTHLQGKKRKRKKKNEEKKQEEGVHPSICTSDKEHWLNSSLLAGQDAVSDCNLALEDSLMITVNCDSVTTLSNEDEDSTLKKHKRPKVEKTEEIVPSSSCTSMHLNQNAVVISNLDSHLIEANDPNFQDGVKNKSILDEGNSLNDKRSSIPQTQQHGDGFSLGMGKEQVVASMKEPVALGRLLTIPKKKLLVLDLNGVLADVVFATGHANREHRLIGGKSVFKRPYCDEFLKFCFEAFDVGIWSSRRKYNLDSALDFLMGDRRRDLIFCWDQLKCTVTGYKTIENRQKPLVLKELNLLWETGRYSSSNTLLVDDSPYKAICNPPNTAIFPYPYNHQNQNDNSLGQGGDLRVYLEGLAAANDVQEYVEKHPFGKVAITEKNSSWPYYQTIINKIKDKI